METKPINLTKFRKEKTPLTYEKEEPVDNRTAKEIALQDYGFKVGDLFLGTATNKWFELYRISKINEKKNISMERAHIDDIMCFILNNGDLNKLKWGGYGSYSLEGYHSLKREVDRGELTRVKSINEIKQYIKDFEDNIKDFSKFDLSLPQESNETALAVMDKNLLKSMEKTYEDKRNQIQLLQAVAKYKMQQLTEIKNKFITIVEKIHRVIGKIELYLGVNEEVVQIQDGISAPADTPISLFQKILYMDEEVGVVEDGGLDWKHIDDFDNWLVEGHLDLIAPLPKCIVILKVRRKDKRYTSVKWENAYLNDPNRYTYILIRNGDKVYRIYADLIISPRLFPSKKEEEKWKQEEEYSYSKQNMDDYHNHFLIIQGILDRSDLLWPLPHKIDIFNEETWKGMIQLIRDDEMLLPDGKVPYKVWKRQLNEYNKVGSRIVYSGVEWNDKKDRMRGGKPYEGPSIGVYNLKRQEGENNFVFWYNPEDTVYDWSNWGSYSHERKKAVAFVVEKDDYCIINYDYMKIEDIDFYINCRQERENYLELIPLLKQLKKEKLKELEEEKAFKELLKSQLNIPVEDSLVDEVIEWWKMKVIEKRPLIREDKKAMRMISSRVKKLLYNK
ncbi:MAG: hypothetical protein WC346_20710 [Methanogenium sp.]|jgi:hypothetical protein